MLKKCALLSVLIISSASLAQAIEFPEGGSPFFYKPSTAYSSTTFDKIMNAYGLNLNMRSDAARNLPVTYATESNGKPVFNKVPMAYVPSEYHDIFTSYGLALNQRFVEEDQKAVSYARVVNGKVVFGKTRVAYGADEWENILAAYSLPQKKKVVAAKPAPPKPKPKPVAKPVIGDSDGDGVKDNVDACPNTPLGAQVNERGCWVLPNNVLFDTNQAVIKQEHFAELATLKSVFDNNPDLKVIIEGHTDSRGTAEYNQQLSERRANAVRTHLVQRLLVSPQRLQAVGYGESRPAYSNETKTGRALNRRVVLTPVE